MVVICDWRYVPWFQLLHTNLPLGESYLNHPVIDCTSKRFCLLLPENYGCFYDGMEEVENECGCQKLTLKSVNVFQEGTMKKQEIMGLGCEHICSSGNDIMGGYRWLQILICAHRTKRPANDWLSMAEMGLERSLMALMDAERLQ